MSKGFEAKVALVTGGASGIGEGPATRRERAKVVVADKDAPGAERVARSAGSTSGRRKWRRTKGSIAPQLPIENEKEQGITVNFDELAKSWADANAAAN